MAAPKALINQKKLLFARRQQTTRQPLCCVCLCDVCINHKACPLPIQTQLSMHMQQQPEKEAAGERERGESDSREKDRAEQSKK